MTTPQVRQRLARVIEAHGLAVARPRSGAEALAHPASATGKSHCASPTSTCRRWMASPSCGRRSVAIPTWPIIMLTGVSEVTTAVECLRIGALDYISQAGPGRGGLGPGRQGAGEARSRPQEPFLPGEPREPGPRARPAQQAVADQRRADAGARARGQGRLHQRPLRRG